MSAWTRFRLLACAVSIALPSLAFADTGDTLVAHLRIMLGQTTSSNSNWTDNQLYACLNDGQKYIAGVGRALEKDSTYGGGSFRNTTLPSDFMALKDNSYLWRNGEEIRAIPRVSMDSLNTIMTYIKTQDYGRDKFVIAEDGSALLVAPETNSADSIVVSYYAYPHDLDSTITGDTTAAGDPAECGFNDAWEQVLLLTARVIALQKIQGMAVQEAIAERDKAIAAMFQSRTLRPQLGGGSQVGD